jgi:hypothetical protein
MFMLNRLEKAGLDSATQFCSRARNPLRVWPYANAGDELTIARAEAAIKNFFRMTFPPLLTGGKIKKLGC